MSSQGFPPSGPRPKHDLVIIITLDIIIIFLDAIVIIFDIIIIIFDIIVIN